MRTYNIVLINVLNNETRTLIWEIDKDDEYMIFLWSKAYMKCDCNRLISWYGYNSDYPCNTDNNDRLIKCYIMDEFDNIIYNEVKNGL